MAEHLLTSQEATEGELFRLLVENVQDYAIFVTDPEGRVRSWNPGAERLLGYSEGEVVGQPAALFFTSEDIQGGVPQREMAKAVETGCDEDARWHVRKDGSRFWSAGTITPLWDEGRNLRGFAKIMRDRTSQKHSDDGLNDALAYAQGVVETVREPLLVLGGDLRVKSANRCFYQTFRVSAKETEGQLIYHLGDHQWDIPPLRKLLEEILPQNTSFDGFEVEHEFGAIGRKVMLLNARRFSQEGNRTELILLAIEDITERRRFEEERQISETRFTLLVKHIKLHSIFTMDLDGGITTWNLEAERILGYSEAEILGQPYSLIFTPEDLQAGMPGQEFRRAEVNGFAEDERWHVRKGGEKFWALGIVTPTFDASGERTGFSKILRDMTERKQAEQALQRAHDEAEAQVGERTVDLQRANVALQQQAAQRRQAEESLRLRDRAIQAVSQGILITDPNLPDNPIIYASPGFEHITGYRADEVLGRNCRLLQGKETEPDAVATVRAAIRDGRECSVELLNYRKDGTKFWNALFVTPVREDQRLAYFVGVQADVTDRRALEQAFYQSQKMEAVGQLAGGVAHDFNNLLTIISGYSDILLSTLGASDPVRESVKAISEAGGRAASLTRQLLAFSRQTVLEPKVLELNEVLRETEKMLRRLIGEDILLTAVLDPHISRIKVDPGQLDQILMNLSVNARDAMPRGGKLTLETRNVDWDGQYAHSHVEAVAGQYVMLAVTDSGSGMTPEVMAHIFEPFFTTKGVGKGTGLGLAVVHGIVKQSGGRIEVYSEPSLGTTFKIYFPAIKEIADTAKLSAEKSDMRGNETILLVEDEDGVRGLALLVLQTYGYKVLAASDGRRALRAIENHQGSIDLLVTDVVMPGMGGGELAEAVREQFPHIKVLFSSGYTDDSVVRQGILEAEVAFLQKPYSPQSLARKVRQILDKK
ncbi:MAG: PAS domain S-box protein [Planctomycetes bacterium]|nr:PAS domain S-box protein [Planctomycetota bacterium]